MKTDHCNSCGAPVESGAARCPFCGSHFDRPEQSTGGDVSGLFVRAFDSSPASILAISKVFDYFDAGWCESYFRELPAIIQVDYSMDNLTDIKRILDETFARANAGIHLTVRKNPGRLPLENPQCRRLLGDRLDREKILKRRSSLSPVTKMVVILGLVMAAAVAAVAVRYQKESRREQYRVREREAVDRVIYPEESKVLETYSGLIKSRLAGADCRVLAPSTIQVSGGGIFEEVSISFDPVSKRINTVDLKFNLVFDDSSFKKFREEFIKNEFGGGTTVEGATVPPSKARVSPDGKIEHIGFTAALDDYRDPAEYINWLLKRNPTAPKYDGASGRIIDNEKKKNDEIIDEDDPWKDNRDKGVREPRVTAREISFVFKTKRNRLAREVFEKALDSLKNILKEKTVEAGAVD